MMVTGIFPPGLDSVSSEPTASIGTRSGQSSSSMGARAPPLCAAQPAPAGKRDRHSAGDAAMPSPQPHSRAAARSPQTPVARPHRPLTYARLTSRHVTSLTPRATGRPRRTAGTHPAHSPAPRSLRLVPGGSRAPRSDAQAQQEGRRGGARGLVVGCPLAVSQLGVSRPLTAGHGAARGGSWRWRRSRQTRLQGTRPPACSSSRLLRLLKNVDSDPRGTLKTSRSSQQALCGVDALLFKVK